uniref:GIPC GH2 domain-containing protein n=1 Tax=Timema tahoe TaxID=61484 RepID=A0A7R9IHG0_9NEOP|nr:unnamed protein product [Timema tahoe]
MYIFQATEIWELSTAKTNSMDFAEAIDNSELEEFGFTDDFIIELWGPTIEKEIICFCTMAHAYKEYDTYTCILKNA